MARFDFSRSVMEKVLRRAFLDGVIELYENSPDGRIHSVALEGTLLLTINKTETFDIKLYEIAQRAQDHEGNKESKHAAKLAPSFLAETKIKMESESTQDESIYEEGKHNCDKLSSDKMKSCGSFLKVSEKCDLTPSDKKCTDSFEDEHEAPLNLEQRKPPSWLRVPAEEESLKLCSASASLQSVGKLASSKPKKSWFSLPSTSESQSHASSSFSLKDKNSSPPVSKSKRSWFSMPSDINPKSSPHPSKPHSGSGSADNLLSLSDRLFSFSASEFQRRDSLMTKLSGSKFITNWMKESGSDVVEGSKLFDPKTKVLEDLRDDDKKLPDRDEDEDHKTDSSMSDLIVIEDDEEITVKKELALDSKFQPGVSSDPDLSAIEPGEVWSGHKIMHPLSVQHDLRVMARDMYITACPLCQAFCQGRDIFVMHVDAHRQSFEQVCLICAQGPMQLESLLCHLVSDHGPASPTFSQLGSGKSSREFQCYQCDRSFPTMGLLHQHLEIHKSPRPQSQASPQSSENSSGMNSYSCEICGELFTEPGTLANHHRTQHGSQSAAWVVMDEDSEGLSESGTEQLETAESRSSGSSPSKFLPFVCQHCVRSFRSWRSLKYHLMTSHGLQHPCEVCLDAFPSMLARQQHEQTHKDGTDKPIYRCNICNKMFASLTHCTSHKRVHTTSKPHVCDTCGSSFFKRGDLTKHVRTVHCPTKHFVCKVCGRTGTRADNMRVHVKIHQKFMTRDQIDLLIDEVYKA